MQRNYTFFILALFSLLFHTNDVTAEVPLFKAVSENAENISSLSLTGGTVLTVTTSSTDETCTAADGTASASASASGSTGTINYLWSNGAAGATISNLPAGTYTVTATDEAGCSGTESVLVNQNIVTLTVATTATDETCTADNGTATASATGGTAAYDYSWSNSGATALITGLSAGTYTVTATDANGCIGTGSATVAQNDIALSAAVTTTDATCTAADGTATASVSGGSGMYMYSWSNSGATALITDIAAGTYTVTATDANGCEGTASGTVGQQIISLSVSGSSTLSSGMDGTATASATGGTAAYSYLWDNWEMTATITGLAPGNYAVTATDANGCEGNTSVTVGMVLPVELTRFTGQMKGGNVVLSWSTATEIDNYGYYLEKSPAGDDWQTIDFVEGIGTTDIEQHYEYTDKQVSAKRLYYRLKQTDFDGQFSYSNVVVIEKKTAFDDFMLYPNPTVQNTVNIKIFAENESRLQLILSDGIGRTLTDFTYRTQSGENIFSLPIEGLPKGIYFVRLVSDEHSVSKEFVKE